MTLLERGIRSFIGRAAVVSVTAALLLLGACSSKAPVEGVILPPSDSISVVDRSVLWHTDEPARGLVRYGLDRGHLDHVAYPAAAAREDRSFVKEHRVTLLDVRAGRTIYYQVGVETSLSGCRFTAIDSFVSQLGPAPGVLTSTMVHIGFGDAHVLTMPTNGRHVLIDAGTREAAVSVRQYLLEHGIDAFSGMLATHVHIDHIGGILGYDRGGILASHPPSIFYDSARKDVGSEKYAYSEVQSMIAEENVDEAVLHRFDTSSSVAALQWDPEVEVTVLNSGTPDDYVPDGYEGTDINNESIVLLIAYGDVRFVIGGDAEQEAEASMLAAFAPADLEVQYYKVQHHGLSDASSTAWVNTLRPRVAFIPNTAWSWDGDLEGAISQTTGRLEAIGAQIYVIDDVPMIGEPRSMGIQHNITFATDGVSYEVRVETAQQTAPHKMASTASCVRGDPDLQNLFPLHDHEGDSGLDRVKTDSPPPTADSSQE